MSTRFVPRTSLLLAVGMVASLAVGASGASAAAVSLCVSSTGGRPVTSGACPGSGTTVRLPAKAADQNTLISILPYVSFDATGVGGKPTIRFSGANLQV